MLKLWLFLVGLFCINAWKIGKWSTVAGSCAATLLGNSVNAATISGTVSVGKAPVPASTSAALYLTASETENGFMSGIKGTKPPPVLSKRVPLVQVQFPYDFHLSTDTDVTVEGASYTFGKKDLTIAARLDTDGVAATRDITDLVGKATFPVSKGDYESASISMMERGFGGKLVTGKK
jgi:hypothetical protein